MTSHPRSNRAGRSLPKKVTARSAPTYEPTPGVLTDKTTNRKARNVDHTSDIDAVCGPHLNEKVNLSTRWQVCNRKIPRPTSNRGIRTFKAV